MINRWLFKRIDNSPLIVFRIIFGLLLVAQAWGSIFTGFVSRLLKNDFTFNFIGFDFIQPFPGLWMYFFYGVMGLFGVGVTLGYKYKYSIAGFTLLWTWVYLMQKVHYNNHYYLLILLCIFMWMAPAHRNYSLDVKKNPDLKKNSMPQWVSLFIILQVGLVYTFGAFAKIYPDWLDGTVGHILMASKVHYPIIGELLQKHWAIMILTYFGLLFDLLITPLMLWKRTRTIAFVFAIFFHLFNSVVFQIGIFPYLALGLFIFFFPTKVVHDKLLKKKGYYSGEEIELPHHRKLLLSFLGVWFLIQLFLPLRHWFVKGDVLWTEEGHRLSWRMMLRTRSGISTFKVVNKKTGEATYIDKKDYLTNKQIAATATKPDIIWQFCQRLKREYASKGEDIAIYVQAWVSVNGHKSELLINPSVDMAQAQWDYFFHNDWLMPKK